MPDECLLWGTHSLIRYGDGTYVDVDSDRAGGPYRVTGSTTKNLRSAIASIALLLEDHRVLLTNWLVDQRRLGAKRPEIDTDLLSSVPTFRRLRIQERQDRALILLHTINDRLGHRFATSAPSNAPEMAHEAARLMSLLSAWSGSRDQHEVYWLLERLTASRHLQTPARHNWAIDDVGWRRLEELEHLHVPSVQAFVAMWFDESMSAAFDEGIAPAIRDCGYVPLRIDQKEHANKIDDEIIAEIRRSRFVVADFTSERDRPRGGVYYEAGFAAGLNIPVIWSCKASLIDQVHFDTRQFNHITWEEPAELREKLLNRIGAVIGRVNGA